MSICRKLFFILVARRNQVPKCVSIKSTVEKYPKIRGYENEVQQRIQGASNKTV